MALGTSLNILVSMDGSPGVNGAADYIINATYNAVIGGYYSSPLVAKPPTGSGARSRTKIAGRKPAISNCV